MKQRIHLLIPMLAGSMLAAPACTATVVFSDSFTNAPGTLIVGKLPQVGSGTWTSGGGSGDGSLAVSSVNSMDTAGKSVQVFGGFTSTLGVGQMLTVQCDTLSPASGTFLSGPNTSWGGISLYTGHSTGGTGTEQMFFGNPSAGFWGTDGSAIGRHFGTDNTEATHVTFTYVYSSGAWTLSTASGYSASGTGTANLALNGLRVGDGSAYINVKDISVDISAVPVFSFTSQTPADGSYSAPVSGPISVQTTDGTSPVNTNTIVMKVDGSTVAPSIVKTNNVTTISYTPAPPLSAGSLHTVLVTLAENGGTMHTNNWSFTTGFPSLPVTLPGPFVASNNVDTTIFTAAGEGWLGTNYQSSSSKTLYLRFSMEYNFTNTDTNVGYTWGGLEFYQDNTEKFLIGKSGGLPDWSVVANGNPDSDVPPSTPVNTNEWHTFAVRVDYSPGMNATAEVWLDPDFTQTEANQPNAPLTLSLNNVFNNIRLRCGFNNASATYSNIIVSAATLFAPPAGPQFQGFIPSINASAAATNTPISLQILFGSYGINSNAISMTVDGNSVTPTLTVLTNPNGFALNYQPPASFAAGSPHSVAVNLTDSNGTPYSTSWGFTVDPYPTLPVVVPGPIDVTGGSAYDNTLWTSQNEWIGDNYGTNSSKTLYTRFSMVFYVFPQTNAAAGGSFGGLHFFQDNTERLLVGNAWISTNWSADAKESGEPDLLPVTPIVGNEWHTMVIKSVFASNAPTAETIWLDPDFTTNLDNQPNAPLTVSLNNTFNQIRLRCGNGSTYAEFTNIVMAANAQDLGFPASIAPGVVTIQKVSGNYQLSWTGGGTLQSAPALTGPWASFGNQTNPQILSTTNAAQFFRLSGQ